MTKLELLTVEEIERADTCAIAAGVPSLKLMENAGQAVVTAIQAHYHPQPTTVLCGPGNNGGDGFVIARLLAANGWPVRLGLLGDTASIKTDAKANAARWQAPIEALTPSILAGAELVIDALFGVGLSRPIEGMAAEVISAINRPVVSVDIPTGIHGNSGEIMGIAPKAEMTVTFFRPKPAHYLIPGRTLCGKLVVTDIGIPEQVIEELAPQITLNNPLSWKNTFPVPDIETHKHTRGHAIILGGVAMTGAARLAARAARRIGSGLITIAAPQESFLNYSIEDPGNLFSSDDFDNLLSDPRITVALAGPGAGINNQTRAFVTTARGFGKPLVIDADALTVFRKSPNELFNIIGPDCVLTPHEGEFARLFDVSGSKLQRARKASVISQAIILLKGPDTIIAAPDGRAVINNTGSAYLATAGSGDVLAGMITGLISQGMPAFEAAQAGAWFHGRAAEIFGPGLLAEDLSEQIPEILGELSLDVV